MFVNPLQKQKACSANDWEFEQLFFGKIKQINIPVHRQGCSHQHKPLFSSSSNTSHSRSSQTSVKTNNFSSAFPAGVAENNRSDVQENWGKTLENWKKTLENWGKNVSTNIRPPRDAVRRLFLKRNFAFSSGILWRLQLSGVGGRKPQEVAGSLW